MKSVRLLDIERGSAQSESGAQEACFDAFVVLDVDGQRLRHRITVSPRKIAGFDATLLVASEELQALFRTEQRTLHRLCKLVGEELRGLPVRVPQAIAA